VAHYKVRTGQAASIDDCHFDIRDNLTANYEEHWLASLYLFGTMAYQGVIPPSAITRYCVLDVNTRKDLLAMICNADPRIAREHEQHIKLTAWLFGNRKKLPKMDLARFNKVYLDDSKYKVEIDYKKASGWKAGLQVVRV
jgi:hypothetical protein